MHRKLLILALVLFSNIAWAWQPARPITVIIGFAPGSGNEIAFRKAASIVQANNPGTNFVIETRPGNDAVVAHNYFLTQAADGYTIAVPSHMSHFVTHDIWQRDSKRFEYNSFINVLTLGQSPLVLVANSASSVSTPSEFATAVQRPNRLINVSTGGGAHQMAYEFIMQSQKAHNSVALIRHQGPAPAAMSAASNASEFAIVPVAVARPLIESGKIKIIGVTGKNNIPALQNVPLIVPDISVHAGWMISLLPGTDPAIVDWYQRQFSKAVTSQEYQSWAVESLIFVDPQLLTPAGTARYGEQLRRNFAQVMQQLQNK